MQSSKKFAALSVVFAVLAMAVAGVASASEYTASPAGPFKAVGHVPTFLFYGPKGEVQEKIFCNAEVLEGTVNAPGSATEFTVTPTFYVCESTQTTSHPNGLGPVTIKQAATTPFRFVMGPDGATQTGLNLQITRAHFPACTFSLVGNTSFPSVSKNSAGEIELFYNYSGIQYLKVANSVTPAEHCPQLYPNGTLVGFYSEPFAIATHPLKIQ